MASIFLTLSAVSSYVGSGSYTISVPITLHIFFIFSNLHAFNEKNGRTFTAVVLTTPLTETRSKNTMIITIVIIITAHYKRMTKQKKQTGTEPQLSVQKPRQYAYCCKDIHVLIDMTKQNNTMNCTCLGSWSKFSLRLTRLRINASCSWRGKACGVRIACVRGSRMSPVCGLMLNPMNVNEFPSSLKNRYGCGLQNKTIQTNTTVKKLISKNVQLIFIKKKHTAIFFINICTAARHF